MKRVVRKNTQTEFALKSANPIAGTPQPLSLANTSCQGKPLFVTANLAFAQITVQSQKTGGLLTLQSPSPINYLIV